MVRARRRVSAWGRLRKKVQNANKRGGKHSIGRQESRDLVAAMLCCKEQWLL